MLTQKVSRQKTVGEVYDWIRMGGGQTEKEGICKERGKGMYVNGVEETARKTERMNVYEYEYETEKNGQYRISHINSRNSKAMKNHYLLTQIADIVMQIYLCWSPMIRETGQSIKNTSSKLLESFRRHTITKEDVLYIERYTTVYLS